MAMSRRSFAFLLVAAISLPSFARDAIPVEDRLKSCDPQVALAAAEELTKDPHSLKEPIILFLSVPTLFQNGQKDKAIFWFYAAQLRAKLQFALERSDRGQLLSVMQMTVGPQINNYAFQDVKKLDRILEQVLAWDKISPNPLVPKGLSADATSRLDAVYSGFRDLRIKLASDAAEIERKAKEAAPPMEQIAALNRAKACKVGEPDPAYARQTIKMEIGAISEFVRTQPKVLQELNAIENVSIGSYTLMRDSTLPSRYTVSVKGGGKTIYAEVAVSREGKSVHFLLACVTHLDVGQRDPRKDVCTQ